MQHLVSPEPRPGPESRRAPAHLGLQPEPVAAPVTAASLPSWPRSSHLTCPTSPSNLQG